MSNRSGHADDLQLLYFGDGELSAAERAVVSRHLASCAECRSRFESIGQAGELYLRNHQGPLFEEDPPPPSAWADLRPRLEALEAAEIAPSAPRQRLQILGMAQGPIGRRTGWPKWLPLAAAIIIGAFLVYRVQVAPSVKAAELLRKASAVEPARTGTDRIRIRVRSREIVRPAVERVPAASEREVAALFDAARYSYEDPLSARSFAQWRAQLAEKSDRVETTPAGLWEIHTTTHSNPLTEAILTLRPADLRPIRGTMHFREGVVEIAEADPAPSIPAARVAGSGPIAPPAASIANAGPAEELEVLAALHRIEADLGEPIEVVRDGDRISVTGTGLNSKREGQVREAVSGLPRVELRFERPVPLAMPPNESAKPAVSAALRSELGGRLGEDVDRVLDASEALMARAFALRSLARRFPGDLEGRLPESGHSLLANLREEHAAALAARLAELQSVLAPVLPAGQAAADSSARDWQATAERVFVAAQRFDQLLNRLLAGAGEPANPSDLANALRQLAREGSPSR